MNNIFETVSFHVIKPCNMKCKFCYATFNDFKVVNKLTYEEACTIIFKLYKAGVQKITFAGGEPMLYSHLDDCIKFAKSLGLNTSIITNGSMMTIEWLKKMKPYLNWIGVSIDSLNWTANQNIGRVQKHGIPVNAVNLCQEITEHGYKLKINTVVNRYNVDEDFNNFISYVKPARWKVFQALKIEEQNDEQFDEIKVSDEEFTAFIDKHRHNTCIVPESNELMTGSYLLIDPKGRLFENSQGKHTYSSPLQHNDIDKCLSEISLNRHTFIKRGGIYNW